MTTPSTHSKTAFGLFVQDKRRHVGLTQKELASRLFITESAVSKWERGLSYPDISLVAAIAVLLGVNAGELITASDDHGARLVDSQARTYRRWRATVQWSIIGLASLGVVASFVTNIAVQHTLSWFWVVVTALATLLSLTTLPLLVVRRRGWITLGAFLASLIALLGVVQLLYGGAYLAVAATSILFAVVLIFGPFALNQAKPPSSVEGHRTVLIFAVDSVALLLFLAIVLARAERLDTFLPLALPVAVISLTFAWIVMIVIRYLPAVPAYRAAIVAALAGAFTWIAGPVFEALATRAAVDFTRVDFASWYTPNISGNVATIILGASLAAAVVLCIIAASGTKRPS